VHGHEPLNRNEQQSGEPARHPGRAAGISSSAFITTGGAVSTLAYAHAPWWGIALTAMLITTVCAGLAAVQLLLPQDSHDRLQWWRDLRRDRIRRRAGRTG
jgi:hypothetical protein